MQVVVRPAQLRDVALKHITVAFKSFVPRSEMWRLEQAAVGRCFYLDKSLSLDGVRVHVRVCRAPGRLPGASASTAFGAPSTTAESVPPFFAL